MTGNPPPISPDGKYYWDGTRWVPRYAPSAVAIAPRDRGVATLGVGLVVAFGVVGLLVVAGLAIRANQSCTVGVAGTDLQVTAVGGGSSDFCQGFVNGEGSSAYSVDQPDTTGTLMCRYHAGGPSFVNGADITVRDKGILKLYGNSVCAKLASSLSG